MDMFKNRQKQEDTVAATGADSNVNNPVKKKKVEEFDQEYLSRHNKYK
jgi:hypothetical protein